MHMKYNEAYICIYIYIMCIYIYIHEWFGSVSLVGEFGIVGFPSEIPRPFQITNQKKS